MSFNNGELKPHVSSKCWISLFRRCFSC